MFDSSTQDAVAILDLKTNKLVTSNVKFQQNLGNARNIKNMMQAKLKNAKLKHKVSTPHPKTPKREDIRLGREIKPDSDVREF